MLMFQKGDKRLCSAHTASRGGRVGGGEREKVSANFHASLMTIKWTVKTSFILC